MKKTKVLDALQARSLFLLSLLMFNVATASATLTFSPVASYDYGTWTSEYMRINSTTPITWYEGASLCVSQGDGWDVAGIYAAGATTVLLPILDNLLRDAGYIGAVVPQDSRSVTANQFVWTAGRSKGTVMSTGFGTSVSCSQSYCNYNTGEPNGNACTNGYSGYQHVTHIYTDGTWDDLEPTDCGVPFRTAVVCERPICAIDVDCVVANTINMTAGSYFPNCICNCKDGYRGARCDVISSSYLEDGREFAGWCERDVINSTVAAALCAAQGPGWALPSITSATINAALQTRIPDSYWTNGKYDASYGNHSWRSGREAGRTFSSGLSPSVTPLLYTNWATNQPDHGECGDGSPLETDVAVYSSGSWNDLWTNGCGMLKSRQVWCYACERSICLMSDCPLLTTARVSGYFPDCVCQTITPTPSRTPIITRTGTPQMTVTDLVTGTDNVTSHSESLVRSITTSLEKSPSAITASPTLTPQVTASPSVTLTRLPTSTLTPLSTGTVSLTTTHPRTSTPPPIPTPTPTHSTSVLRTPSSLMSQTYSGLVSQTRSSVFTQTRTELKPVTLTLSHAQTEANVTNTAQINATQVGLILQGFPLFTSLSVEESAVRSGASLLAVLNSVSAVGALLDLLNTSQLDTLSLSISSTHTALGAVGVTGNAGGFFKDTPPVSILLTRDTTNLTVTMGALPSYAIDVNEGLELYVTLRDVFGSDSEHINGHSPSELLLVGRLAVVADKDGDSTTSTVTAVVSGASGLVGGMAAELQGVGALSLMNCADPTTRASFGSFRVLSPFAIFDSYVGVVLGNAALAAAVGIIQVCIVTLLKVCQPVRRTIDLMAAGRFPSILITSMLIFQTGTAFSSSQIISQPADHAGWELFIGGVGFTFSLLLPVFLSLHPYLRIGRAYQEYALREWLAQHGWSGWLVWVVPRGAIYSDETRLAYGGYISAYRAPPKQVWWTSMPTWTPLVFLVAGLIQPDTVEGCQALYVCMGAIMIVMGAVVVWCAPLRSDMGGWLDAASRVFLGCIMICMAITLQADGATNEGVSTAIFGLAIVMLIITVIRVMHRILCWYVDGSVRKEESGGTASATQTLLTVWTHIPGSSKKVTHRFTTDGDALIDMQQMSVVRDEMGDDDDDDAGEELGDAVVGSDGDGDADEGKDGGPDSGTAFIPSYAPPLPASAVADNNTNNNNTPPSSPTSTSTDSSISLELTSSSSPSSSSSSSSIEDSAPDDDLLLDDQSSSFTSPGSTSNEGFHGRGTDRSGSFEDNGDADDDLL